MYDKLKQIEIPDKEHLEVTHRENGVPIFIITSDYYRQNYFLYKVNKNLKITKVEENSVPTFKILDKYIEDWHKKNDDQ